MGKDKFQIEALTLIQNIMENRLRHTKGPVQYTESFTLIGRVCFNSLVGLVECPFHYMLIRAYFTKKYHLFFVEIFFSVTELPHQKSPEPKKQPVSIVSSLYGSENA